ncbi:AraC family transcriptional regulator [Vallitaleaceae bacterium 9-2]
MRIIVKGKYEKRVYQIFFAIFIFISFMFIGVFSYNLFRQDKRDQENMLLQTLEANRSNSQLRLEIAMNEFENVVNHEYIRSYVTEDEGSLMYFYAIKLQQELQKAVSRVNNISFDIYITPVDTEKPVLTSTSSEQSGQFFETTLAMSEQERDQLFYEFVQGRKEKVMMQQVEDEQYIMYVTRRAFEEKTVLFFLVINTESLITSGEEYTWFLCNDEGIFAWNQAGNIDREGLYQRFSEQSQQERIVYENHEFFVYPYANIDWTILAEDTSDNNNFEYVLIRMLLPSLFMVFVAIVGAIIFSRLLYRPIYDLMTELDSVKHNSKYDEIKILHTKASEVKDLNIQLRSAINERDRLMEHKTNRDLLFGVKDKKSQLYNQKAEDKSFAVVLIEFIGNEQFGDQEVQIYKNEIVEFVQNSHGVRFANLSTGICALIVEATTLDKVKKKLQPLINNIYLEGETRMFAAISDVRVGFESIKESYEESQKILEYRFLYRTQVMLTMDMIRKKDKKVHYYPLNLENQLIHQVVLGDEQALTIYDHILEENDVYRSLELEARQSLVLVLIGTLQRIIQELKVTPEEVFEKKIDFWSLADKWNQDEVFNILRNSIDWLCLYVRDQSQKEESQLGQEMLRFIEENYQEDIMLIDLAERMNISEKYCGILFKKETGENFKAHLNQYRIRKAVDILHTKKEIKVATLAKEVGFNSANTFIRVFSKTMGMTPKQYKDRIDEQ